MSNLPIVRPRRNRIPPKHCRSGFTRPPSPRCYPRRPEKTPLHKIIGEHLESCLEERAAPAGCEHRGGTFTVYRRASGVAVEPAPWLRPPKAAGAMDEPFGMAGLWDPPTHPRIREGLWLDESGASGETCSATPDSRTSTARSLQITATMPKANHSLIGVARLGSR